MKSALILAAAALACGTAFAQAPAGVVKNPSQEQNPNMSGGKAQANADGKKGGMAASGGMTTTATGSKAMDMNGDGYVSRKEWNDYHGRTWSSMKGEKRGVPWADVEARMKGGPN